MTALLTACASFLKHKIYRLPLSENNFVTGGLCRISLKHLHLLTELIHNDFSFVRKYCSCQFGENPHPSFLGFLNQFWHVCIRVWPPRPAVSKQPKINWQWHKQSGELQKLTMAQILLEIHPGLHWDRIVQISPSFCSFFAVLYIIRLIIKNAQLQFHFSTFSAFHYRKKKMPLSELNEIIWSVLTKTELQLLFVSIFSSLN